MSKKIIVGNWKMNPLSSKEAKDIARGIIKNAKKYPKQEVVICPPVLFFESISGTQRNDIVSFGFQDVFPENTGSHTGEVSIDMAKKAGAKYIITGHSERRKMGEGNEIVNTKLKSILNAKLKPILCIGEQKRDKEGDYLSFIENQIKTALNGIDKKDAGKVIVAYEPIWAIGAGEAMDGALMMEMQIFVKKVINDLYDSTVAKKIKVLYGGSVNPENAFDILKNGEVDGLLIGRQSLYPDNFGEIIKIADDL